jgi:hypothetical protein
MVGTFEKIDESQQKNALNCRKERAVLLYRRLINEAGNHGVRLVFNTKNKKVIIAPGNWKAITFDVLIFDDNLIIKNKEWGVDNMELLIPNINRND